LSGISSHKGTNPITVAPLSWCKYFPKASTS
jgi:hypothetical protein